MIEAIFICIGFLLGMGISILVLLVLGEII